MTRGYQTEDIQQKIIELLQNSNSGMSGVEISKQLGINRITVTKYLNIFAAEGLLHKKNIGNVTLWFAEKGLEKFYFPDDYYKIGPKYLEFLTKGSANQIFSLIKNCLYSGAVVSKLITEAILPAIHHVRKLYEDGKIGMSEEKLLQNIISNSLQIFTQLPVMPVPKKNVILIAEDYPNSLISEASSAYFHSEEWNVFHLGDMSESINVLFELDLQKLLRKVWKQKPGIMIVVIFADTEEGLNFFATSVNSLKKKISKNIKLVLCGTISKKTKINSDLISTSVSDIVQWSQSTYENFES